MANNGKRTGQAHEYTSIAITIVAIAMFVGIGGAVVAQSMRQLIAGQGALDRTLMIAMLLNIALILMGWRRQRDIARVASLHSEAEARARQLASHDPLTGFLNRRSLAESGAVHIQAARDRQRVTALLMLDLDHFKTVNDLHGHAAGDALLRRISADIAEVIPPSAILARLGGDEFACVLAFEPSEPATVERLAQRLVTRLAQPLRNDGLHLHVSASIGIARSDRDGGSIDALMRSADIAMYAAKKEGRNRYCWFDRAMETRLLTRNELEIGLRTAIPEGQIIPFFEQQIDLASGRLVGFEVLARWDHPTRGLIGPDQFIPIAEEAGLIADLSMNVIRQALLAARDWAPELTLSVNISPWQLRDPWLPQKIIKLLVETGFPASRLEVEITESALFENLALAKSILGSMKNQGIRIALDDFGTGYSSLAHLRALPFDRIKIDKSFVGAIAEDAESAAIVNAITRLAESLNLPVTAEGIEDKSVEDRLRALGCDKGQGYLYGRPVGVANVRRLLSDQRLLRAGDPGRALGDVTSQRRAG